MPADPFSARPPVSMSRAVRHHTAVVLALVLLFSVAGFLFAADANSTYTSTARVLINPTVGNPFVPTSASVRQDELTSLETEAQVARSQEVLAEAAARLPGLSPELLGQRLQVSIPPNTQVLTFTYTSGDAVATGRAANVVANVYLANRERRSEEVNDARIAQIQDRISGVTADLRRASTDAQRGNPAERLFQEQLGSALRNELVSLNAQRSALESSESPPGSLIAPATTGTVVTDLVRLGLPFGAGLLGLVLGVGFALLLERRYGTLRSATDVEAVGVPVAASVPAIAWHDRLLRRKNETAVNTAFDATVRRLRAVLLDVTPRPEVLTVAPTGAGPSDPSVCEAIALSFARSGHRVVLVRTDGACTDRAARGVPGVAGDDVEAGDTGDMGLAQALLHDRLPVLSLLRPTDEPLLSRLGDGGFTAQSRELLVADRLRSVLQHLLDAGHMAVVQSPGIDTPEGEACVEAADVSVVVVNRRRTRPLALGPAARLLHVRGRRVMALIVDPAGVPPRTQLTSGIGGASARGSRRAGRETTDPRVVRSSQ